MHVEGRPTVAPQRVQEDSLVYRVLVPLVTGDVICHEFWNAVFSTVDPASVVRFNRFIEPSEPSETNNKPLQCSSKAYEAKT